MTPRQDSYSQEIEALRRQVEAARDVINRGVEIMTTEQVGQWTGVRAWLEMDTAAYATLPAMISKEKP